MNNNKLYMTEPFIKSIEAFIDFGLLVSSNVNTSLIQDITFKTTKLNLDRVVERARVIGLYKHWLPHGNDKKAALCVYNPLDYSLEVLSNREFGTIGTLETIDNIPVKIENVVDYYRRQR